MSTMHPDQLTVTPETVRRLVAEQFPQWAGHRVRPLAGSGTVNALFRVGDDLTARLPLQPLPVAEARRWLEAEAAAARELAGRTRFVTPEPVAIGEPGAGYPLPWAVQTWVPGTPADDLDVSRSDAVAHDLAAFIADVRAIPTRGRTFSGAGRGGDLRTHDAWMEECFHRSEALLDVPALRRVWAELRDLPRRGPDVMSHADLTPGNVLLTQGRLAGVIDVGGLRAADPALDPLVGWHLFDRGTRAVFRAELGSSDLEWARAQAWAFEQAMGLVWYYRDSNPAMARTGRTTLDRMLRP